MLLVAHEDWEIHQLDDKHIQLKLFVHYREGATVWVVAWDCVKSDKWCSKMLLLELQNSLQCCMGWQLLILRKHYICGAYRTDNVVDGCWLLAIDCVEAVGLGWARGFQVMSLIIWWGYDLCSPWCFVAPEVPNLQARIIHLEFALFHEQWTWITQPASLEFF